MAEHLRRFAHEEGWCSSAGAGNTPVFRTERRRSRSVPPYHGSCAQPMVNNYTFMPSTATSGRSTSILSYFRSTQAVPEGHEYGQAAAGARKASPSSARQWHFKLRRPFALQRICDGLARRDSMAFCASGCVCSASVHRDGRKAGYRYDISILQGRVLIDPSARPAGARPPAFEQVIREKPRSGSPQEVRLIFNPPSTQDTGTVSAPASSPRSHPSLNVYYTARDQGSITRKIGPWYRDDHQQQLRLRHRQAPAQLAEAARDRPLRPIVRFARSRTLSHDCITGRGYLPSHQQARWRGPPTRLRPAFWPIRASTRCGTPSSCSGSSQKAFGAAPAPSSCGSVGPRSGRDSRSAITYQLRACACTADRTPAQTAPLSRHRIRLPRRLFFTRLYNALLRPGLAAALPHLPPRCPLKAHSTKSTHRSKHGSIRPNSLLNLNICPCA